MAGDTTITIIGNLTADPELRYTQTGAAVANFTVASTPRTLNRATGEWEDGEALFMRCTIWKQAAENVAESLTRGARVVVQGRLQQRSFQTKEGEKRTVIELTVDEIGPSLRYATATITKNGKTAPTTVNPDLATSTPATPAGDLWGPATEQELVGANAGGHSDTPPF
ncbi:single-stranded DNA-binding protein [Amycolatopsis nalaikhensis]|uniref:Single-stranded DNA-binding protein n=1 Tax=Amycolatopsis nalaikhensis TaxID=715472 RepID=A0ABY8XDC8_9PSEU|nr:single-stranded DNA-binding protein [Amycolatopsis sp. 2-2]WIV52863.1 single-stranded DNA-binding protein [Amycolatopsis sp. 2-2]WIV52952.1 single-stranded DNA-binding protein [Amycolatopsis sp. 2-2]